MEKSVRRKTYLTECILKDGDAAQYDAAAKRILSSKSLLAMILKETVSELRKYDVREIENFIEGVKVSKAPAITGSNTEDAVPDEGTVRYDVRFFVILPDAKGTKLLFNLEAQKVFKKNQMPRGIYYSCRIISGQKDREFQGENYGDVKKTYGIWLNFNAPKGEVDSTYCVKLMPEVLAGKVNPKRHRYDLMNVTMIGLNDDSYKSRATDLHGYLGTIFTTKLSSENKIRILKEEYGVEPTEEVEKGVEEMCNLGEALIEETRQEERKKARKKIRKMVKKEARRADREKARADQEKARADAAEKKAEEQKKKAEEQKKKAEESNAVAEALKKENEDLKHRLAMAMS